MNFRYFAGFLLVAFPAISSAAALRPETLRAWDEYVQKVESRTLADPGANGPFLQIDQDPQQAGRVRGGEIIADSRNGPNGQAIPHGLIHDWMATVFIPGVTIAQVSAILRDYQRYPEFYKPSMLDAALIRRTGAAGSSGEEERFRVRTAEKFLFLSAIVESEYLVHHYQRDERRWYSISQSTRIQELRTPDQPGENSPAGDEGARFVWRIFCLSKYEQKDGGVYVEQENIVLSRGIPISLRWMVESAIRQVSRDMAVAALRETRNAVQLVTQGRSTSPSAAVKSGG